MTKILLQIPEDLGTEDDLSRVELCAQIFSHYKSELEDELDVSDAYIVDFCASDADSYLVGKFEPDQLLSVARIWNRDITLSFAAAIEPIERLARQHGLSITEALLRNKDLDVLKLDSPETYELRQCACAIDDHFTTFGPCMNYLPNSCGYLYARVLLRPDDLKRLEADPSGYAIISVTIK